MATAILVDGGFFIKRYRNVYPDGRELNSTLLVERLYDICLKHLSLQTVKPALYRIFFYDCPPYKGTSINPISKKEINFEKTKHATFRLGIHRELLKHRKVALRLGTITPVKWQIGDRAAQKLLKGNYKLEEDDVVYGLKQKGVDMRIGLDVATLAFKKQVNQIVLIAGDGDFVPAIKLARREGIDFILDSMWNNVNPDLYKHADGLIVTCPRPSDLEKIGGGEIKKKHEMDYNMDAYKELTPAATDS